MPRSSSRDLTLLLLLLALVCRPGSEVKAQDINSSVADQDARDNRESFCEGIDVKYTLMTDREIEIQRNKDINLFHESTDLLKEVIQTKDYTLIFDGSLWVPILITVIFALSIISLLLYLFNIFICCKRKKSSSASVCIKLNLCFAVAALIIFLLAIIAMSIFISNARSSIQYVNCSINIMNDDLRNGAVYKDAIPGGNTQPAPQDVKFQGMLNMKNIFVAYGQTLKSLENNHVDSINNIVGYNVPSLSKNALDSIEPFYNNYKDSKTPNMSGVDDTPTSISSSLPAGKFAMDAEFNKLYQASLEVHEAGLVAKSVIDTGDSAIFVSAINSASDEIDEVMKSIDKYINLSNDYFGNVSDRYDAIQIVYIIFNFLCMIVAIIIIIGLCSIYHQDKCKVFVVWRILIFIIGLFCVLFFAATVFISGVSWATSSSCQIFRELHTDEGIEDFVKTFEISARFETVLKTCYSETASGELGEVFLKENSTNSPEFQVYNDAKTLLSVYAKYEAQLDGVDPNGNAQSTQDLDDSLEKSRIGLIVGYSDVTSTLSALNQDVNCDNFYYALTPVTCDATSTLTCYTIQETTTLNVPICLLGQGTAQVDAAKQRYDRLKAYLTETQNLMASMIDDVNGTKIQSLNSQYKVAALAFKDAAAEFDKIKVDQQVVLNTFSGDLKTQTDCRIVRLHMQIIEDAICFNVVAEMYSFMVAALVGSVFFFCFVWNLCCAEYCMWNQLEGEDDEEEVEVYENKEVAPIIMPTEPNNEAAEDDFFINNAQGGYIGDSDSIQPQEKNIEYRAEAAEDDFMGPNTITDKGKVS